ncbi:MAG: hypothetical protein CMN55_16395 [Sneathiella sp.]|uniref:hypothetical protein n=1 Tax=Sneathiella sp. TaxID=1964365 RepID=UPI000C36C7A3|nr:hypothetical protein [Sneathiella sp.]MAL80658.1 hypothetical protein [Sneathiella sp.]
MVWWLDLDWGGGLLVAVIYFPCFYWLIRRKHQKERLKKLDKIEKAAEIKKRLRKLDRIERAQSR